MGYTSHAHTLLPEGMEMDTTTAVTVAGLHLLGCAQARGRHHAMRDMVMAIHDAVDTPNHGRDPHQEMAHGHSALRLHSLVAL
jgi:hypothetical protein